MKKISSLITTGVCTLGLFGMSMQTASALTMSEMLTTVANKWFIGDSKSLRVTAADNSCMKKGKVLFAKKKKNGPHTTDLSMYFPFMGEFNESGDFLFINSSTDPKIRISRLSKTYQVFATQKAILKNKNAQGNYVVEYQGKATNTPKPGQTISIHFNGTLNPAGTQYSKATVDFTLRKANGKTCEYTFKNKGKRAINHPIKKM